MNPDDVLSQLRQWQTSRRPMVATSTIAATAQLQDAGVDDADRDAVLDRLTLGGARSSPRVLANYWDLYALERLDEANLGLDLSDKQAAADVRAVFQAAEIAMLNIRDLALRVTNDVREGRLADAEEKYRWISSFHEVLHALSLITMRRNLGATGTPISISASGTTSGLLADLQALHQVLMDAGLTAPEQISEGDIGEPGRNLTHQTFVDSTYLEVWMNHLQSVNVPGVRPNEHDDAAAFYARFVGSEAIELAANELEQIGDNFFKQFRAIHQLTEIVVAQANCRILSSIEEIVSPSGNLLKARESLDVALDLLGIMTQNIAPLLRNLSVNKYQYIRPSLGITSGSSSPNIKSGLFSTLYPLFVAAVKSRAMELAPYTEVSLSERLQEIVSDPYHDAERYNIYSLILCANRLHIAIRTHRELHIQFVKTQIGLPPLDSTPTASTSGAPSAMRAAHGMRQGAHGNRDPIIPVFEAMLGKTFPAIPPFGNIFRDAEASDTFVTSMLVNTAAVVSQRSGALQRRVHERSFAPTTPEAKSQHSTDKSEPIHAPLGQPTSTGSS